jgi:hypothetical protein
VIGDTTPLTTLFYCLEEFGRAPPSLHEMARRHYDGYLDRLAVADRLGLGSA